MEARKLLLIGFLAVVLGIIVLTWGSVGSAALTLALLLGGILIAWQKFMQTHDPEDLDWEE